MPISNNKKKVIQLIWVKGMHVYMDETNKRPNFMSIDIYTCKILVKM